ncbi:hypothetical protein ES708_25439 [subsurface metagenome]
MKKSDFRNDIVHKASEFLQSYMKNNRISHLSADECAELLTNNNILSNQIGPKPGFNFRQMLRDGRDGLIDFVDGAYQESPNKKWYIFNKN